MKDGEHSTFPVSIPYRKCVVFYVLFILQFMFIFLLFLYRYSLEELIDAS